MNAEYKRFSVILSHSNRYHVSFYLAGFSQQMPGAVLKTPFRVQAEICMGKVDEVHNNNKNNHQKYLIRKEIKKYFVLPTFTA